MTETRGGKIAEALIHLFSLHSILCFFLCSYTSHNLSMPNNTLSINTTNNSFCEKSLLAGMNKHDYPSQPFSEVQSVSKTRSPSYKRFFSAVKGWTGKQAALQRRRRVQPLGIQTEKGSFSDALHERSTREALSSLNIADDANIASVSSYTGDEEAIELDEHADHERFSQNCNRVMNQFNEEESSPCGCNISFGSSECTGEDNEDLKMTVDHPCGTSGDGCILEGDDLNSSGISSAPTVFSCGGRRMREDETFAIPSHCKKCKTNVELSSMSSRFFRRTGGKIESSDAVDDEMNSTRVLSDVIGCRNQSSVEEVPGTTAPFSSPCSSPRASRCEDRCSLDKFGIESPDSPKGVCKSRRQRRNSFLYHEELMNALDEELRTIKKEQMKKWNFDFSAEVPLIGEYCWTNSIQSESDYFRKPAE